MANFSPSILVDAQAKFNQKYLSAEWRLPDTAILSSMYLGAKANPALASLRNIESKTVKSYLPIRKSKGTATDRLYNHSGTYSDSSAVTLSWQTYAETFSINLDQGLNNVFSFQEQYAAGLQSCVDNLLERHETLLLANMKADFTQINKGRILNGTFDPATYVMEVENSDKDYFFQRVKSSMNNNLYRRNLMVITDSIGATYAENAANQGAANATNLGWTLNGMNIAQTTNEINADYEGAAIVFPMEMAGIIPWIPIKNRQPLNEEKAMNSVRGDYGSFQVPVLDANGNVAYTLDFAISMYSARADGSAVGGTKQDDHFEVEVSVDIAYVSAPLSGLRATGDFIGKTDTVVYGFGVKSAGTQS